MKSQGSKKQKVFVGLSGGVDSSVSAALLKEDGFDVTGVFIKVWSPDFIECAWKEDKLDAMRVCAKLGIPFITLDLEKEYKKEVVDYMINEYKAGRTPNPDVMCNRHIKFGAFFKWAMKNGADFVATGHYAKVCKKSKTSFGEHGYLPASKFLVLAPSRSQVSPKEVFDYKLLSGDDKNKDQSYFLWTLTQKELSKTFFPVGNIEKPEVRKLAEKFGLITADKKDSQGLCFLGKVDMKDFLGNFIKPKTGKVLDLKGKIVGTHNGAMFLTLGQRHGFTISKKSASDKPLYIVEKDLKKNTITVGEKSEQGILENAGREVEIKNVNWISEVPEVGEKYSARIRYRQPLQECVFEKISPPSRGYGEASKNSAKIKFKNPQNAISPGQSVVVYDANGEECLGGGVIM